MRRRLFTLLSAASLVLCVAACALWVRSGTWHDDAYVVVGGYRFKLESANRRLALAWHRMDPATPTAGWDSGEGRGPYRGVEWDPWRGWYANRYTGFYTDVQSVGRLLSQDIHSLVIAYEFVIIGTVLLPLGWYRRHRLAPERRRRAGLCPACGYDLRATPDRCPECGAPQQTAAG